MGLFDSIRRVVGGGASDTEAESATEDDPPELVDTSGLDVAGLRERAEDVAGEVDQLDFSLSSLEQFDAAIEAGYDDELHTAEAPETYDRDVVRFGCYLGEVLVRVYDGEWTREDGWGVTIAGPDDEVTVSVFEVALRSIQTDPVFAAVTERAATEVGLDGTVDPTAVPDVPEDPDAGEDDPDETAGEEDRAEETTDDKETAVDEDADSTADEEEGGAEEETAGDVTVDEATAVTEDETGDITADEEMVAEEEAADGEAETPADVTVSERTDADPTVDDDTGADDAESAGDDTLTDDDAPTTAVDDTPAGDDTGDSADEETTQTGEVPSGPDDIGAGDDTGFEFGSGSDSETAEPDTDEPAVEADGETEADGTSTTEPTDTTTADDGGQNGAETPEAPPRSKPPGATETDDGPADTEPPDADDSATDEASAEDILASAGDLSTDETVTDDTPVDTEEQSADEMAADADGPATEDTDRTAAGGTGAEGDEYTNPFEAATTPSSAEDGEEGPATEDDEGVSGLVDEAEPDRASGDDGADASDSLFDDDSAVGETPAQSTAGAAESTDTDPMPDPSEFDGLRAKYAEEAEGFVDFWNEHDLDYTPESLERLDALVAAEWDDDRFDDAAFGSEETFDDRAFTSVAMELGSYFGEVLVRELDAEWSDETANDGVIVEGPDGPLAIPVFRVAGTSLRQAPVFAKSYESLLDDLDA